MVRMSDIALLAPVPLMHLDSAARDGLDPVAFGSEAWDVLKHLPPEGDHSIPVLIYASLAGCHPVCHVAGRIRRMDRPCAAG
jgi:hypothetical protein